METSSHRQKKAGKNNYFMVHLLCAELQYLFQQVLHFPLPALPGAAQFLLLALCQLRECRGLVLLVLLFQLLPQLLAFLSTRRENKAFGFLDIGVCYVRKIRNEGDVIGFEHLISQLELCTGLTKKNPSISLTLFWLWSPFPSLLDP